MFLGEERNAKNSTSAQSQNQTANQKAVSTASDSNMMQQQPNQVFVFSTQLANRAAESVCSLTTSSHKSIISYHLDQPDTKQFIKVNFDLLGAANKLSCDLSPT